MRWDLGIQDTLDQFFDTESMMVGLGRTYSVSTWKVLESFRGYAYRSTPRTAQPTPGTRFSSVNHLFQLPRAGFPKG